jgi:hypothetical protein
MSAQPMPAQSAKAPLLQLHAVSLHYGRKSKNPFKSKLETQFF